MCEPAKYFKFAIFVKNFKVRILTLLCLFSYLSFTALPAQTFDARLLHAINSPNAQSSDAFFKFMSQSNSAVVIAVPAGLMLNGLLSKNKTQAYNACMIGLATALNAGVTFGLKYSVNRERPFIAYPGYISKKLEVSDSSFPSGHTSSAFATATALTLAYPQWYIALPAYFWAGTVAYSRMHLGVHYPFDVLAGILIGAGSAYLSYKGNKWLVQKFNYLNNCERIY